MTSFHPDLSSRIDTPPAPKTCLLSLAFFQLTFFLAHLSLLPVMLKHKLPVITLSAYWLPINQSPAVLECYRQ